MTMREALTTAVDFLRSNGGDEPLLRAAAKTLERRAEKLRAKQEAPAVWQHYCLCGERKGRRALLCVDCHRAIPSALMLRWHLGKPADSRRAWRDIVCICETRISAGKEAA